MLVLSRQRDETIMIGDEIEITIVDIRGDKVRLGISAPTRIAVHRKEVYDAIRTENEQASAISSGDLPEITASSNGTSRPATATPPKELSPGPQRKGKASLLKTASVAPAAHAGPEGQTPSDPAADGTRPSASVDGGRRGESRRAQGPPSPAAGARAVRTVVLKSSLLAGSVDTGLNKKM